MSHSHLLPFSPTARYVQLSHNPHKPSQQPLRKFLREEGLATAFPDRAELKLALEQNELWLIKIMPADASRSRVIAGARFATLLSKTPADFSMPGEVIDATIAPPLPRHNHLVVECTRESTGDESWSMTWEEYVGSKYALRSRSLGELWRRALEITVVNAEATLRAFERFITAH